jgi:glutathione S-transferase
MVNQYKLHYFDIDGVAEPIRNAFRLSKISFEDVRLKFDEWQKTKSANPDKFIYGQMPVVEIDSVPYAQSIALLRYVGKLGGLYPTDAIEALKVDEIIDALGDISKKVSASSSLPEAERVVARKKIAEEFIKPHLGFINKRVGSHGFAVGDKLSIADLVIANQVNSLHAGSMDGLERTLADPFDHLIKITHNVKAALEKIKH